VAAFPGRQAAKVLILEQQKRAPCRLKTEKVSEDLFRRNRLSALKINYDQ